jgi:hypothetical protein
MPGRARRQPLGLGYSDRAIVYLNGERLCHGAATYCSRENPALVPINE